MRRLVTVAKEKQDGSRDVLELLELENPGVATRVARDTLVATWAGAIPPVAIQFRVGQGDVSPQVVTRRGDTVAVYGPLPPRERKQLSYSYVLSATVRRVAVPIDQPTEEVDLLLETRPPSWPPSSSIPSGWRTSAGAALRATAHHRSRPAPSSRSPLPTDGSRRSR